MMEFWTPGPPKAISSVATMTLPNEDARENVKKPRQTKKLDSTEQDLGPCESKSTPKISGLAKFTNVAKVKIVAISEDVRPTPPLLVSATSNVEEMEAQPKNSPPPRRFCKQARRT
mmetsp:Transcript_2091/g.4233  ORF Transcript_2091/g.4233 Transcript_2091/m.4233 type:complete len:116 (-) Transcript_2091:260-607(-)